MYKKTSKKKVNSIIHDDPNLNIPFSRDLDHNCETFQQLFGTKSDLTIQRVESQSSIRSAVIYLYPLVDNAIIDEFVIQPLQQRLQEFAEDRFTIPLDVDYLDLSTHQLKIIRTFEEGVKHLLEGHTLVLLAAHEKVLAANTGATDRRAVSESISEPVVSGPRDSFNESLVTNIGLIRSRLRSYKLKVEKIEIGKLTNTSVAILFVDGVAQPDIVREVRQRLEKIEIDGILDSQYIEEMIEDPRGYTPFPTIFNTERPDRITAGLLEGRVGILVDGTPVGLLVPATMSLFLYANEDYYQRYDIATMLKILRTITFMMSLLVPGFYVALLTYHQEMLPTPLLIALTGQREGVPFGIGIEVALMEITFEILREAGIRLPKTIGAAVSIVGGLVLGQSAVEAGLVGPGTVIAVSITAIASFCTPSYNMAISARMLRFLLLILAASFGAFGLFFGLIMIVVHLNTLRSFSVPYLAPASPYHVSGWKDLFVRAPWWAMKSRPEEIAGGNTKRMPSDNDVAEQKGGNEE